MTTDERYWANYDGLQLAKHAILKRYLGGWFPKLTSANNRVLYIDCHAGRGRHTTGQEGSPIIALEGLLKHKSIDKILERANINFVFFERNNNNYQILLREIQACGKIPQRIKVMPYCTDYEPTLCHICEELRKQDKSLAPCFAFLDPYGFDLSMDLMNVLLEFPQSELFVSFMFRWVDMAIQSRTQDDNMNRLFGCDDWEKARGIADYKTREQAILQIFSNQLEAKYITHMHMLSSSNTTKYVLIHASNHPSGRDLMKQAMWSVCLEGSFAASERDNPNQLVLLNAEPDLQPLKNKIMEQFKGKSLRINDIYQWLNGEIYLPKHLHKVLREYDDQDILTFSEYGDRFAFGHNPLVNFK
ncbi:MAG: three-Cys-motif partner protein TcmP [Candidatus Hodarchaeales archaeon]